MTRFLSRTLLACSAASALSMSGSALAAGVVFDDFNVNEGHFALQPSYAGQSSSLDDKSTADRVTTDSPLEGVGHEKLVLTNKVGSTMFRCRFLSGGGGIANNLKFTTSAGVDGKIGYYLKTSQTGWVTAINLDGAAGATADMDGGVEKPIIADGEWHLYEWDLDAADWTVVNGIGGGHPGGLLLDGDHFIDSINLRYTNSVPGPTTTIFLDYVARNPNGSIADLLTEPCASVPRLLVENGPVSVTSTQITVRGVSATAAQIKVYQDSGSGWTVVGTKNSGIVAGDNPIPVSGLIKGATVSATQVIGTQEGCTPTGGVIVGGGANPRLRLALSLKETTTAGPVGANGTAGANSNIHFIPATNTLSGACPGGGTFVIYPSNDWQTVTIQRGTETIADVPSVTGTAKAGSYYGAGDSLFIQVYAFRTLPISGIKIFSATPGTSDSVTSSQSFVVDWSWPAVAGAQGYRVVRNHSAGFTDYRDTTTNSFSDNDPNAWLSMPEDFTLQPNSAPTMPSVVWNGSGTANEIPTAYAILDAIAFASEGDSGPYDIFIDDLANGSHGVFQDFEGFDDNTPAGAVFRQPSFSGSTSGMILPTPNRADITTATASSGVKSLRAQWQFKSAATNAWVRFTTDTTSVMPSPMVDLSQPISFKILVLPVGSAPVPTTPPTIAVFRNAAGQLVLNWTGSFKLQSSVDAASGYADVSGVTTGPWTNNFTEPTRFFRLAK